MSLKGTPTAVLKKLVRLNTEKDDTTTCRANGSVSCNGVDCVECPMFQEIANLAQVRQELDRRKPTESHKGGGGGGAGGAGISMVGKPEPIEFIPTTSQVPEPAGSPSEDMVNTPSHYTSGGIECLDAIQASMTEDGFKGFLKGNVMKYIWRYEKKINPIEDLKKAQWYLKKLEGMLEKG